MEMIALVGNPNTGKTTFFNNITKSNAHIGNWHGVTTDAEFKQLGNQFCLIDLAGTYSLSPYSLEEQNTANFLLRNNVKLLNLCEQKNLQRNLMLTLQLIEVGFEVSLVVNTFGNYKNYDNLTMSKMLGCDVAFCNFASSSTAKFRPKFESHKTPICDYLDSFPLQEILTILKNCQLNFEKTAKKLQNKCQNCKKCTKNNFQLEKNTKQRIDKFVAIRLLEGDDSFLTHYEFTPQEKQKLLALKSSVDPQAIFQARKQKIDNLIKKCKLQKPILLTQKNKKSFLNATKSNPAKNWQNILDKILLNKFLAFPLFLLVIYLYILYQY